MRKEIQLNQISNQPWNHSSEDGRTKPAVEPRPRLPEWLKVKMPGSPRYIELQQLMRGHDLHTVCEEAHCPNIGECWERGAATFMILGEVCTRTCGFCSVARGKPALPQADEPQRLAEAARRLGLKHVVITSVTRDDLADGGAEHFYQCIMAVRQASLATVEVLTPDFIDHREALVRVLQARPEVFNHNTETVPRLYRKVRGSKSDYRWTLELLRRVKKMAPGVKTKSGLMLGLGETHEEIFDTLADLRDVGCDFLTMGQYLQPDPTKYISVARYLPPEEFEMLGQAARQLGFLQVASGPFVRSSYHAREMAEAIGS